MEFPFDINHVLPHEITILNGDYRVLNPGQTIRISAPDKLTSIIDTIGEASYKAQGLSGAVTTARKFRTSDHRLYIIKKSTDNRNSGSVVGILKVGLKHLYVYNSNGQVHERTPLCVLDFYVHENKQRLGYGKQLFDTMLEFEKCAPYELAIDRPSNKCLAFLHKHYNLSAPIHQVNNFVVYHAFFNPSPVSVNRKPSVSKQQQELTSWLVPAERQKHKSFFEQKDSERYQTKNNNSQISRQPSISQTLVGREEHRPVSYYATSYGRHYNQNAFIGEQTDKTTPTVQYTPRTYSQVFSKNNSNLSLSRNHVNQIIPANKQSSLMDKYRGPVASTSNVPNSESFNSMHTLPTNNRQQQQSTTESSSSAWRVFGIPQLFN